MKRVQQILNKEGKTLQKINNISDSDEKLLVLSGNHLRTVLRTSEGYFDVDFTNMSYTSIDDINNVINENKCYRLIGFNNNNCTVPNTFVGMVTSLFVLC